jgi:hypothetical protein
MRVEEVSMADKDTDDSAAYTDRRKTERRQSQQPFEGPDRRKDDRRSGEDRRRTPRS